MDNSRVSRELAVDLQQLRFAIAAADYGSFRQASDVFSIPHSVLSRSIRQLEHRIGVSIFHRSSRGVQLTPAGIAILKMARSILEQIEALVATAKSAGQGKSGRLSVGFSTSICAGNLRASLTEFKSRHPEVELATVERSRTHLASALRNGTTDILVLTGDMPPADNDVRTLWGERIFVCLPDGHALTTRSALDWRDLKYQTVLFGQYDPGRELEELLTSKFAAQADRPRIERHDVSRGIMKSLISMRLGIALVLESEICASFAGLTHRELRDDDNPTCVGFSAHWRPSNVNPALEGFLRLLAERFPDRF